VLSSRLVVTPKLGRLLRLKGLPPPPRTPDHPPRSFSYEQLGSNYARRASTAAERIRFSLLLAREPLREACAALLLASFSQLELLIDVTKSRSRS
jgi:hypothetical protein